MDNITIGYLSWKRHNIFNQTVVSHSINGLHDIIKRENRYIYFQEITQKDIDIANKYNCKYLGNNNNIGILNAFIELVNNCNTEYFIFSEKYFSIFFLIFFSIGPIKVNSLFLKFNFLNASSK